MNRERLLKTIKLFGLSQIDAEIYLYLAVKGRLRAKDVAEEFSLSKHHVSNILERLLKKGIVTSSREQVTTFSACSFEKMLSSRYRAKLVEVEDLEKRREEFLSNWRLMITEKTRKHLIGTSKQP